MKKLTYISFVNYFLIASILFLYSSCLFVDYHNELKNGKIEDVKEEIKDVHEEYCECKEEVDKIINEAVRFDKQFKCKEPLSWAGQKISENENLTQSEVRSLLDKLYDAPCED
ncbi:MAG: hypothetical protein KFKLKKLM_00334 [Flavobacteriales bacterium]|nr:hypothetical protein [Flavobacteriales bacterium]